MVKLNKIYTRTGDDGTTALVSGPRRLKHDLRVDAYGTIDETNSAIGIARLYTAGLADLDAMLMRIQNDLFDLGADLAAPDTGEALSYEPLRIIQGQVDRIEQEIDTINARLDPLKSFILPGGTPAAAHLHLARTIARRAERIMVDLSHIEGELVDAPALKYINRLSDFLFVAARHANDDGKADVLWVPGKNR
ncbi:cob(I)yrinic acid a,c-diamide adenosyltransferase [Rhizobium sp. CECT 9324]|jgi:cob(I)alamin adenosyltransferase|uniref:cob(I)yrinic acid a,c-diamide adenosyltransferase n=1 Tax=Rhizobium sp. CECT 9324 TaxID=2845820 RepID=UPI001E6568A1|nr:cob(I)yrinic acid a,c-diamide adenosyltransferase [Rhizobium sp. CECT 9324]CAH0338397.1 Corrinoid adenosyltransferase [Rhizobium sp. CECT 9324]